MNTDIYVEVCNNPSTANVVYNMDAKLLPSRESISVASWFSAQRDSHKVKCKALHMICESVLGCMEQPNVWLFVGDSVWQDDTRITRYKKLWKRLEQRGFRVVEATRYEEQLAEQGGHIKYFGSAMISIRSIASAVKIMDEEKASYIVVLPKHVSPSHILSTGWGAGQGFDPDLLKEIVSLDGLLFKAIGEFDDNERGMVGIGGSGLINCLV